MPPSDADRDIVVGITGLDAGDNPQPGTAVAAALRADPLFRGKIIGLPYDPMLPGAFQDGLFDGFSLMPWPGDSERTYREALGRARRDFGVNVCMPCLDSDVPTIARLAPELRAMGIHTLCPPLSAVKRRFKWNLPELARVAGIDTPKTEVLYDVAQIHSIAGWSFPVYIKGSLADAEPAYDAEEAAHLFPLMAARWGYPVLVQERRAGVEYLVAGVAKTGGIAEALIGVKKVKTNALGKATAAVTIDDPALFSISKKILAALEWAGPFELEFLKDASNGRFYLLEINGRFPAWISFAASVGSTVVTSAVHLALGRTPAPSPNPPAGIHFSRRFRVECGEFRDAKILGALARLASSTPALPPQTTDEPERPGLA